MLAQQHAERSRGFTAPGRLLGEQVQPAGARRHAQEQGPTAQLDDDRLLVGLHHLVHRQPHELTLELGTNDRQLRRPQRHACTLD